LGHKIGEAGISSNEAKRPKNQKEVFFGLIGYYRKFINYFATVAEPLLELCIEKGFSLCLESKN
jgi:hypothetical protein